MDPRISFVTLAVDDLPTSRRFYLEGLGWRADLEVPGEVVMIRVGEYLMLSLWASGGFEQEVGRIRRGEGVVPVTLAHNVASEAEVDAVLDLARVAGSPHVQAGERRAWGGYTGYFSDPDGFRWEVAVNPGPIGQVVLPPALREEVWHTPSGQPVGPAVPAWAPPPLPRIGRRVGRWGSLEPLARSHAAELFDEVALPEHAPLWTYLRDGPFDSRAAFADHVEQRLAAETMEVVIRDGDGIACGLASLMRAEPAHGCVEIGNVLLGPRLQRTPAATEAMSVLAGHVFDLGYRRYEWKCDALNAPSRRAAQRLGFAYEGTFRRHRVSKGRSRDTAWYAMTVDDWPRIAADHERWLRPENFVDGVQRQRLGWPGPG